MASATAQAAAAAIADVALPWAPNGGRACNSAWDHAARPPHGRVPASLGLHGGGWGGRWSIASTCLNNYRTKMPSERAKEGAEKSQGLLARLAFPAPAIGHELVLPRVIFGQTPGAGRRNSAKFG